MSSCGIHLGLEGLTVAFHWGPCMYYDRAWTSWVRAIIESYMDILCLSLCNMALLSLNLWSLRVPEPRGPQGSWWTYYNRRRIGGITTESQVALLFVDMCVHIFLYIYIYTFGHPPPPQAPCEIPRSTSLRIHTTMTIRIPICRTCCRHQ